MFNVTKSVGLALCLATAWQSQNLLAQQQATNLVSAALPVYSIQDAVNMTLQKHPELKPYALREQRNKGLLDQANVGRAMTIEANITDVLGTGDYSALNGVQTEIGIGWYLEQTKLDAKVAVAKTQAQLNNIELQMQALDLAAKTASDYVVLLAQQEQLKLAKLQQYQAKKMLADIRSRRLAGQISQIDELRAKADLANKNLVVEDLVHEIEASKSLIAAQWSGNGEFQAVGALSSLPHEVSYQELVKKLESNPKFSQFITKQRIAESKISLASLENDPSWRVTAGIKHNQAINDFAFTAGVEIPLGSPTRNVGKINALKAEQLESAAMAEAWRSKVSTQILLLTHKLEHNTHVAEGLTQEIIPALQQASEQAQQAYRKGNYSYTDWYAVAGELTDAQNELIDAYANIHLYNIELQRLTGSSVSAGSSL